MVLKLITLFYFVSSSAHDLFCHHPAIKKEVWSFYYDMSEADLAKHGRLRDLTFPNHTSQPNYAFSLPIFIISQILADKVNASLKLVDSLNRKQEILFRDGKLQRGNNPLMVPIFADFFNLRVSPWEQWTTYSVNENNPNEAPFYRYLEPIYWNFLYCDLHRLKKEPVYKLSIFLSVYTNRVWCLIVAMGMLVSCIHIKSLAFNFQTVVASLLSAGVSGIKKDQLVIVLWLFCVKPLVDIYSGDLSSHLVCAPEEKTFETIAELNDNGYSTLLPVFETIEDRKELLAYMTSNESGRYVPPDFMSLKKIYSKLKSHEVYTDVGRKLVLKPNENVVVVDDAVATMYLANSLSYKTHQSTGLMCHLGKREICVAPLYWAFFPPNHLTLANSFQHLFESGIVTRMYKEAYDISSSARVPDRNMYNRLGKMNKGSSEM